MQTSHQHDDYQSQREFERLRNKSTTSIEVGSGSGVDATPMQSASPTLPASAPAYSLKAKNPTAVVERRQTNGNIYWSIFSPFTVMHEGNPIPTGGGTFDEVTEIDFRDTDSVTWEVYDDTAGRIVVKATSVGGGGTYALNLGINADASTVVASGDTIRLIAGTNVTLSKTGNSITINAAGTTYSWIAADVGGGNNKLITNGQIMKWIGSDGVYAINSAGPNNEMYIGRPITLQQDSVDVGYGDVLKIDFLNATPTKPVSYTSRVWFDLNYPGSQRDTIMGWYEPPSAYSYAWLLQAGAGATTSIDNGETVTFTSTGIATVTRTGNTINYDVPKTSWFLQANAGATTEIENGETVTFTGTGLATVTRSGNTINVGVTAPAAYTFNVGINGGSVSAVASGATVDFVAGTNVTLSKTGTAITINADDQYFFSTFEDLVQVGNTKINKLDFRNPLTQTDDVQVTFKLFDIAPGRTEVRAYVPAYDTDWDFSVQKDGTIVGTNNVHTLNFDNDTGTKPAGYSNRVWFDVVDDGSGVRRIVGWYEDTTGSGGTNTLQLAEGAVNVGNNATTFIDFTPAKTTETVPVAFDVIDDGGGNRRVLGFVPAYPTLVYSWDLQVNGGTVITINNTDNVNLIAGSHITISRTGGDVTFDVAWPAEDTWQVGINGGSFTTVDSVNNQVDFVAGSNITLSKTGNVITIAAATPGTYSWELSANGATSTTISNTETVDFVGKGLVTVNRIGNKIEIDANPDYTDTSKKPRKLTGILEFDNTGALPRTDYKHGYKKDQDIQHNWSLSNWHGYKLFLKDISFNDSGALTYYREGNFAYNGQPRSDFAFRNFPYFQAVDKDTIKVWVVQSRLKPTVMRFHYILEEA